MQVYFYNKPASFHIDLIFEKEENTAGYETQSSTKEGTNF